MSPHSLLQSLSPHRGQAISLSLAIGLILGLFGVSSSLLVLHHHWLTQQQPFSPYVTYQAKPR